MDNSERVHMLQCKKDVRDVELLPWDWDRAGIFALLSFLLLDADEEISTSKVGDEDVQLCGAFVCIDEMKMKGMIELLHDQLLVDNELFLFSSPELVSIHHLQRESAASVLS